MLSCCQTGLDHKPRMLVLEVRDKAKPAGEAIARLLVERHVYTTTKVTALVLSYLWLGPHGHVQGRHGEFSASYIPNLEGGRLSLSSSEPWSGMGFIRLGLTGLEGQRIGTYLMNEVVQWAKQWPDADVQTIHLMEGHARDAASKARRNRFYEQFGLRFDFTDGSHQAGTSRPITPRELVTVDSWKQNIQELPFDTYLAGLIREQQNSEADRWTIALAKQRLANEFQKAWDRPLRWALAITLQRHGLGLAVAAAGAALVSIGWLRW